MTDLKIKTESYLMVPGTTTMVCALTLESGDVLVGHWAPPKSEPLIDPEESRILSKERALASYSPLEPFPGFEAPDTPDDDLQASLGHKAAE